MQRAPPGARTCCTNHSGSARPLPLRRGGRASLAERWRGRPPPRVVGAGLRPAERRIPCIVRRGHGRSAGGGGGAARAGASSAPGVGDDDAPVGVEPDRVAPGVDDDAQRRRRAGGCGGDAAPQLARQIGVLDARRAARSGAGGADLDDRRRRMAGMTSGASSASTTTAQRPLRATVTPMPASRRRAAAGAGVCSRWRRPRLVIGAWASDRAAGDLHGVIAVLRPQRGDDVGACAVAHAGDGAPAPDAVVRRARFTILLHGSSFGRRATRRGACATRRVRRVWTQDSVPPAAGPGAHGAAMTARATAGTTAWPIRRIRRRAALHKPDDSGMSIARRSSVALRMRAQPSLTRRRRCRRRRRAQRAIQRAPDAR